MVRKKNPATADMRAWRAFALRQKWSPFLGQNPLYVIPHELIAIICRDMPDFWRPAEANFERDLAATAHGGFFEEIAFPCPFLPSPGLSVAEAVDQAERKLHADGVPVDDRARKELQFQFKMREQEREDVQLRDVAYLGWLMTNTEFLGERDHYRSLWEDRVASARRFLSQPMSFLGEKSGPISADEAELLRFYRKWGLHSFLTWDLPVPMMPQIHGVLYENTIALGGAGLFVFLPWHLWRDKRFSIGQLAKQWRMDMQPEHLKSWFSRSGNRKALGYKRLKNLFVVLWCWKLALSSRYGERLNHNIERLDRALASLLHLSSESIKKVRLTLEHIP